MRKSRAFLAFLLAFLAISGVSHASDTIPLSCAKKSDYTIRISNVIKGCEKTEFSLGAGAIPRSLIRPSTIDKQLMYRFKAAQAAAKKMDKLCTLHLDLDLCPAKKPYSHKQ